MSTFYVRMRLFLLTLDTIDVRLLVHLNIIFMSFIRAVLTLIESLRRFLYLKDHIKSIKANIIRV